ncbi:MAG: sodium:solute symporter family protein, partial [Bacteroidota bacterium]
MLSYGLVAGFATLGTAIMYIYSGAFIVPKMLRFKRSITLGDLMQELYGPYGGTITGILGGVYTISLVGVQILALGYLCENLLGWRVDWSIGLGGAILILYASFGGVKSVTITDIFQFIVFVIVVTLIANVAISEVGGIKELLSQLPADSLAFYKHEQFPRYLSSFLVWGLFPAYLSAPPIVQRILMARHRQQATNMLFITAAFLLVVRALVIFSCLAVLLLAPNIKASAGGAFAYVINQYFPPALKGLSVAGLLAIVMSTLDSFLNAGGLLVTHNVLKPCFDQLKMEFNELKAVRYITFLMGCLGILAAFSVTEVRTLSYFGMSSFAPVVTLPLIAGILGLKTDTRSFLVAFSVTTTTFILSNLLLPTAANYLVFPISVIANTISFFTAHIIKHRGIAKVVRQSGESELWTPGPQNTLHILFALFVCFNYMVPYFMYTRQGEVAMFAIKLIGATLCVGLLLKPYWNDWFRKHFPLYWHFSLLFCLPFTTTTLYMLNGGGTEWTVNVALSIMLLVILVDWKRFIIISLAGVGLGILCSQGIKGHVPLSYDNSYTLVYTCLFSTLVGLIFARSKEQRASRQQKMLKAEGAANQASLLRAAEERVKALKTLQNTGAHNLLQVAKDLQGLPVEGAAAQKLHAIEATLIPLAFQLQGINIKATDYLRLQSKPIVIDQWLKELRDQFREYNIGQSIRFI